MIPTRRLFLLLGGLAVLGVAAALVPGTLGAWAGAGLVLLAGVLLDAATCWRAPRLEMERELPASLALGVWTDVRLTFRQGGKRLVRFEVFDRPPTSFQFEGLPAPGTPGKPLVLGPGERLELTYRVRATERGEREFLPAHVRVHGPLGLVARPIEVGVSERVRVLPNFKAVSRYALLAVADRVGELGIRQVRRRGSGMEFDHLRSYREGDQIRQIDWKASSRRRELISREYQDERDQHIVLLLDCGRTMRARTTPGDDGPAELTHFDHVLNASLLLSHVALRQGDSVAVATFGGHDLWIPRQRGPRAISAIVDRIYDLQTTTAPSDFADASRKLAARQHRRALVLVLTNLYDTPDDAVTRALTLLRSRHVVLVASLREHESDALCDAPLLDLDDALVVSAAHEYRRQRTHAHRALTHHGIDVLDVTPEALSVQLVNRYLEIKRSGAL